MYYIGHYAYASIPNRQQNGTFNSQGTALHPVKVTSSKLEEILPKCIAIEVNSSTIGGTQVDATYVLTEDGKLYGCDCYRNGVLSGVGKQTTDFEEIQLPAKVRKVKSQDGYTMALLENGEVYAWGYNTFGQFGTGEANIGKAYSTPIKLDIEWKVTNFALGEGFAVFELFDGTVVGAGKNEYGQLGTGDTVSTSTFVRCPNLED